MFLFIITIQLFLLFLLFFSDYKEKAFNSAKNNYQLNIDKYTTKFEDKAILFDKLSIDGYIKEIKNTDFIYGLYNKRGINISIFDKEYLVSFMNRNDKKVTHLLITNY